MAQIENKIDQYKLALGHGHRQNLFHVVISFPAILGVSSDDEDGFSIMCDKAQFPKPRDIEAIPIDYQGEDFKIPGSKTPPEPITISFKNRQDFRERVIFENWINLIQADKTGIRAVPSDIYAPTMTISILNHARFEVKKCKLFNVWPSAIGSPIETDNATKDISITDITLQLDSFELNVALSETPVFV